MRNWLFRACIISVVVSMAFTGWFGWIVGGDNTLACILGMVAGVCISAFAPLLWWLKSKADQYGAPGVTTGVFLAGALLFAALDAASNVGAVFAMREADIMASKHQTKTARNVDGEVARIEARLAKLNTDIEAYDQAGVKSPAFYQAQIAELKTVLGRDGRNIWQRSRECADVTVKESAEHCKEILENQQLMAKAQDKSAWASERLSLSQRLPSMKLKAEVTPERKAPVMVLMERFGQLFSGGQSPSDLLQTLIYLGLSVAFGVGLTIASSLAAYAYNWLGPAQDDRPAYAPPRAIPDATPLAVHDPEAAARDRQERHQTYIRETTREVRQDEAWERVRQQLQALGQTYDARRGET